jgi:cyclopropane-fatty-acyl-phospholipid synthase
LVKTLVGKDRTVCQNLSCLSEFFQSSGRAKRNVANHYDLKDSLFDQFLDPSCKYSCGHLHSASNTLADAQITKLARLGIKLCLQPN